ncbi:ABC transporter ATP-binding protein [Nocardia jejuensis]|uniref:ABC transporter ATP-binding protein n=1 Tax=Nocardia jejuensis TaxID=328049 RepID=UPI00082F2D6F|nr:nitrate/sulfonate/bicarbonate ABC transporter ATP-binding protein [Nocardia jejuensis]
MSAPVITVDRVTKTFTNPSGEQLPVLSEVCLELRDGEIVALLGKSGSGKSTLLRIIAGLVRPSAGTARHGDDPITEPSAGTAMVFQTFALLPWLTVRQNVELGLRAQGVPVAEHDERVLRAIDMIGLDGFENAYPKELSGGMRQRVGFARALVVQPEVLLMDEPFSALDVLTAENLRGELIRLWAQAAFPTKTVLMVTHNIEEAVQLADRILVLDNNPGRIKGEIRVNLEHPRDTRGRHFLAVVDQAYRLLTDAGFDGDRRGISPTPTTLPLPAAGVDGIGGMLDLVAAMGGRADLPELAGGLRFELDDIMPLVDAAALLGLATAAGGDLELTLDGRDFAEADIDTAKRIFARAARSRAPLVAAIDHALESAKGHRIRDGFFLDLLRRGFTEDAARQQLRTAIDWGRYAELYEYDAGEHLLMRAPASV